MENYFTKLKAFFPENEIEWRVQSCGIKNDKPWAMVLCYIQARAIQNRLDEVMGCENWKDEYRVEGNNIICRLSLKIDDEWVAKENGSAETDIEPFKGGISGAFKRVASSGFGIGRYLYDLEDTFAVCSLNKEKGYNTGYNKKLDKCIYWETPRMLPKFLPKITFNPNSTKDVYEQVIKPHVAEEMEIQNTNSFNRISCAIYNAESIEELERLREKGTTNEYRKDWANLLKYKPKDHQELMDVFEEQKKTLMSFI